MDFSNVNQNQQLMYGGGYNANYNQNAQKAKMTTGLSQEEINELRSLGSVKFNLNLTREEELKCKCFHKENGNIVVKDAGDGYAECPICHERFYIDPLSYEEVEAAVSKIISILQMTKTYFLDCPDNAVEYFYSIALISKLPKLYQIAMDNYQKHVHNNPLVYNNQQPNTFRMYDNIVSPSSYYNNVGMGMGMGFNPNMNGYNPNMMGMNGYNPNMNMNMNGYNPNMGMNGYNPNMGMNGYNPNIVDQPGFITSPNNMTQQATAVAAGGSMIPSTTNNVVGADTVTGTLK